MLKIENIVGAANDPPIADRLHELEHRGRVEYLTLSQEDTQRHRLRAATESGTECAVILGRSEHLYNGAVLLLNDEQQPSRCPRRPQQGLQTYSRRR